MTCRWKASEALISCAVAGEKAAAMANAVTPHITHLTVSFFIISHYSRRGVAFSNKSISTS